jgi:3-oxoacyl-[acyl-carrier-protein] synthase-3
MKATFKSFRISSVIGVVPSSISYFDNEIAKYNHDISSSLKLKDIMGYGEHRIVERNITTSDLARLGIRELISRELVSTEEVAALFFISQTPDYIIPPTSSILHGEFNFSADTYCVDINDGCNGYIKGLFEAISFLNSTENDCALIVAGDVLSPLVSKRDRNSFPLVGDAATVTVIRKNPDWVNEKISITIRNDGTSYDKLIIPAGGARKRLQGIEADEIDSEGNWRSIRDLRMNGRDVFAFTQTVVPTFLQEVMEEENLHSSSLDRLYLHQANSFIIDRLRKKLQVSADQMPDRVVRKYGNSSSGTIPMLIASEPITDRSLNCLLSGFGVGLSWGSACLTLQRDVSQGVLEFE